MIKLVLCDMDLTLVMFGRQSVSADALQAIHDLLDEGVYVGAVSGRGLPDLRRQFAGDESCIRTAVASNGCQVLADGMEIARHPLDRAQLECILDVVRPLDDVFFTCDLDGMRLVVGGTREEALRRFGNWKNVRFDTADDFPPGDLVKVNLMFGRDSIPSSDLIPQLRTLTPSIEYCVLHEDVADMMPAGVNKATGMQNLLDHFGISEDETLVFGDSENDLALFRSFGNTVAMANATQEIRELARWHIGPCTEDACAEALKELAVALQEGREPSWMSPESDEMALDRALNDPTVSPKYLRQLWLQPQSPRD